MYYVTLRWQQRTRREQLKAMAEEKIQRLVLRRREEQESMLDVEKKKKECLGHFEKCFRELGFDTQARNLAVQALKNRNLHLREIIEEVSTHPPQLLDLWIISACSAFRVLLQGYLGEYWQRYAGSLLLLGLCGRRQNIRSQSRAEQSRAAQSSAAQSSAAQRSAAQSARVSIEK